MADGKEGQAWASQRQSRASTWPRDNVVSMAITAARVLPRTAGPRVLVLPKCPGARSGRGGDNWGSRCNEKLRERVGMDLRDSAFHFH